ncbi:Adenine DNA glycosylase [subsurface metagenome]
MDAIKIEEYRTKVKKWGRGNYRDFPWRRTQEPYKVLLAEIMLHRTQAVQVARIYESFIRKYPDIKTLARASKSELHKGLFTLGLKWRVNLIKDMAEMLVNKYGSKIPKDKSELLSLPGISDYIACSVRCFAWNMAEPLRDTNTVRVIGRIYNMEIKDSSRRNSRFKELAVELVDPEEPRAYNFALLDLADQVCTKKEEPKCNECPLSNICSYNTERQIKRGKTIVGVA